MEQRGPRVPGNVIELLVRPMENTPDANRHVTDANHSLTSQIQDSTHSDWRAIRVRH